MSKYMISLIVVLVIAGAGWFIYKNRGTTKQSKSFPTKQEYAGFYEDFGKVVTYSGTARNTVGGAVLQFPASVAN